MEPALPISQRHELKRTRTDVSLLSNEVIFVLCSLSFAFLIRLFLLPQNTVINGDGAYYASLGGKIIAGNFSEGISTYWSPLYPFLIGLTSLVFHDLEFAGRLVSVIAGTLLIIPAYFLIADFYGRKTAYFGTILIVIYPFLIKSSGWVMTESLYTLIFTTAVLIGWLALRGTGKRNRRWKQNFFLTGLLFGAAYLTKPEAIGFLFLFFIFAFTTKFFRRNISFRSSAVGFLLLLIGFAIFSMPYIVYIHEKTGHWMISKKLLSNFTGYDSDVDSDKGWLSLTSDGQMTMRDKFFADVEKKNPPLVKQTAAISESKKSSTEGFNLNRFYSNTTYNLKNQVSEYIRDILPYSFIFFILIGFLFKPWRRMFSEREFYLTSFIICTLIGYALTVTEMRYLFALIPIFLMWTARGIVGFGEWASKLIYRLGKLKLIVRPLVLQSFAFFILLISLIPLFASQLKLDELQNTPFEEKEAGLWIKDHSKPSPLVMSPSVTAAFYAGGTHTFLPDENFATVLEYAKRKKVDYVVYSQRRLSSTPTAMPNENQNLDEEFKLVFQNQTQPGYQVFVYQVRK